MTGLRQVSTKPFSSIPTPGWRFIGPARFCRRPTATIWQTFRSARLVSIQRLSSSNVWRTEGDQPRSGGLITDLCYFSNGHSIVPAARKVLLSNFETELPTRRQGLLISVEDLLAVIENGLAAKIRKHHFYFRHP